MSHLPLIASKVHELKSGNQPQPYVYMHIVIEPLILPEIHKKIDDDLS